VPRSAKEQIQSGLRLGAGLGVFLIGVLLLGQARSRLEVLSSHHQAGWSDWVVWLEIILSVGLLLFTVHVWYQWLAGCMFFGTLKGLIALVTGRDIFPLSQVPATRLASLTVVAYCVVTVLLLARFMDRKPTIVDRVAITLFLLCLLPSGSFPSIWEIVGLAGLLASWGIYRWREGRAPTGGAPVSVH
jgi:hypothetical protein